MDVRVLVVVGALASGAAQQAVAQNPLESLEVLRALATKLRPDARTVVQRFACYDGMHPCHTENAETAHPLLRAFAEAAGAQLVSDTVGGIPPCPWGWDKPPAPSGYRLGIARITIRAETARVLVLRHCDNPPGYLHGIFGQDDEYELVRDANGVWQVRATRMLRITSRSCRCLSPRAAAHVVEERRPGAPAARR
jgi:hypothetical protein